MSFTSESIGGEYKHQLTIEELPSHTHKLEISLYTGQNTPGGAAVQGDNHSGIGKYPYEWAQYVGDDQAHNNIQPYVVVYCWRRTA